MGRLHTGAPPQPRLHICRALTAWSVWPQRLQTSSFDRVDSRWCEDFSGNKTGARLAATNPFPLAHLENAVIQSDLHIPHLYNWAVDGSGPCSAKAWWCDVQSLTTGATTAMLIKTHAVFEPYSFLLWGEKKPCSNISHGVLFSAFFFLFPQVCSPAAHHALCRRL